MSALAVPKGNDIHTARLIEISPKLIFLSIGSPFSSFLSDSKSLLYFKTFKARKGEKILLEEGKIKYGTKESVKPGGEPLWFHIPSWFRESKSSKRINIRTCPRPGGSKGGACAPEQPGGSEGKIGRWPQIVHRRPGASSWGSWLGGVV
jgi:hypothetical protein